MFFLIFFFFFFNDTATTEIYTLSLHDALPISFLQAAEPKYLVATFLTGSERLSLSAQRAAKPQFFSMRTGLHPAQHVAAPHSLFGPYASRRVEDKRPSPG